MSFSVIFGIALAVGALFLTAWGESRINLSDIVVHSNHANEHDARDGAPMTATGGLSFARPAADPLLDGDYAYVERRAQTCAWTEHERRKKKGAVEPYYEKRWSDEVPDSERFARAGHDNQPGLFESRASVGAALRVGDYEVPEITRFYGAEPIAPTRSQVTGARSVSEQWAYLAAGQRCSASGAAAIGDQRVGFRVLRAGDLVTIFGRKDGRRIATFRGEAMLSRGLRDQLIERMEVQRDPRTWLYRGGGALLLWIALYFMISPAVELVSWLPIVGGLARGAATALTLLLALGFTMGVVFLGWGMGFFTSLFGGLLG